MKQKFTVTGMSCAACSAAVERAVGRVDGVSSVSVSLLNKSMTCEYNEGTTSDKAIIAAVKKAGFRARTEGGTSGAGTDTAETPVKTRLIVSAVFLIPLLYISMGHMAGAPIPAFLHGTGNAVSFALTQLLLTLPVLYVNRKFFIGGFTSLFHLSPNMDTLVALGSSAAVIYGVAALYIIGTALGAGDTATVTAYSHDLYFESAATILTLVTVGKYLEERSKIKTASAVEGLKKLSPDSARIIKDGVEQTVKASALAAGDIIIIRPGERIPADGTVIEGESEIDESALTGESMPVSKATGSRVMTATVNKNGSFKMRADVVGSQTTFAKIIDLVAEAGASKAPVARLADKVAGIFVPVVCIIAVVTAAVWLVCGYGVPFALSRAIAVLVISCPCALGLATPVAVTVSAGKCASIGILVKSAATLENISRVSCVIFDKTGTLTKGESEVCGVFCKNDTDTFIKTAASLEAKSEHSLAAAVVKYASGTTLEEVQSFSAVPGMGVYGTIDKTVYYGGSGAYMQKLGVGLSDVEAEAKAQADRGATPLFFACERGGRREFIGAVFVSDALRESSAAAVARLNEMGVRTVMLTGDNERTAKAVAAALGITEVIAGVLPDGKEAAVAKIIDDGKVKAAMVGDGVNDSPALTRADVGIAMGRGTDAAVDCADVVLLQNDPSDVPEALYRSRRTMRIIRENLFWAFFYNAVCIPIAAGALFIPLGLSLSPMIASAAMSLSSLFVVSNALRLNK